VVHVRVDMLDLHIVQDFLLMQQMLRIKRHCWATAPISTSPASLSTFTQTHSVEVDSQTIYQ
jgi:hypothetical protein